MDRSSLQKLEDRILLGLVDFYYADGHKEAAYLDPFRGGIYENKLAGHIGFAPAEDGLTPTDFTAAAVGLEEEGYVRRMKRKDDYAVLGIWPTRKGLDRAEYLRLPWYRKVVSLVKDKRVDITVSFVTTLLTILVAWLLGMVGIRE